MDLKQEFLHTILPIFGTLFLGFTTWLFGLLNKFLVAKTASAVEAGKTSLWYTAISKVTHIVEVVVHEAEVTAKAAYELAAADGIITAEEGKKIKDDVIAKILSILGTEGKAELISLLGISAEGLVPYLGALVEKVVSRFDKPVIVVNAPVAPVVASPLASAPGGLPSPR